MEIWKPIKNYEGLYSVSNYGRVRSEERTIDWNREGRTTTTVKERILSPAPVGRDAKIGKGYEMVILNKNNKRKNCYVHRLVGMAFIPNPLKKRTINHKDGNRRNNHVENLEWATDSENALHSYRELGRKPSIRKHRGLKLRKAKQLQLINS